ncbi:CotD family spore coat protein [Radiobacillus sp. PE A8.2]|uniref:CotD family spore coat protein n=1 Tax=Radiobacillus sp. PE A8.2 TaxID=3380349 RepID=UPI00388F284C
MRHHKPFGMNCGCPKPVEKVVYPTKFNQVDKCFEYDVEHVHPSHTNVVNHHLVKNTHVFPHSTSVNNTWDSVNVYGGSFNVPTPPTPNVPPMGQMGPMAGGPTAPQTPPGPGYMLPGQMRGRR